MKRVSDKDYVIEDVERDVAQVTMSKPLRRALTKLTLADLSLLRDYMVAATSKAFGLGYGSCPLAREE